MPKRDFERVLLEAVDEGLSSVGESSRQAIYFHLEKSFNIKKAEIPEKVEVFEDAIERIFGAGADFIEILIMKRLYEKIGGSIQLSDPEDFAFADYVAMARRNLAKRRKKANHEEREIICGENVCVK